MRVLPGPRIDLQLVERLEGQAARQLTGTMHVHRIKHPGGAGDSPFRLRPNAASAPLLPALTAGPIHRLLHGIGGQHAEGDGNAGFERDARKSRGALAGHVVEMRRLTADHGAERDQRVL